MNVAITFGHYINKLTYDNFVEGLYVIDYSKKIYVTSIFIGIKVITNLVTGEILHYSNGWDGDPYGYKLFIIEDNSLIKIQVKIK